MLRINLPAGRTVDLVPIQDEEYQNESCVCPGFELECNSNGHTVINLALSGEFIVDFVHYHQQTIWLKDPHDCLPQQLRTFNASGSTLRAANHRSFTFWNCTFDLERMVPGLNRVGCLSGKDYDVMVLLTDELSGLTPGRSQGAPTPGRYRPRAFPRTCRHLERSKPLDGLGTIWIAGNAKSDTELVESKSLDIFCYNRNDEKNSWIRSKLAVMVGMMTPWILLLAFSCYISRKSNAARDHTAALTSSASPEQVQRGQETSPAIIRMDSFSTTFGMDSPTIASNPKIQITENSTKPRGDYTCTICLLDYCTSYIAKILPDCNHHFLNHCIDPWLKKKATCPLCLKQQHHRQ